MLNSCKSFLIQLKKTQNIELQMKVAGQKGWEYIFALLQRITHIPEHTCYEVQFKVSFNLNYLEQINLCAKFVKNPFGIHSVLICKRTFHSCILSLMQQDSKSICTLSTTTKFFNHHKFYCNFLKRIIFHIPVSGTLATL